MNLYKRLHPAFEDLLDTQAELELIQDGFQFTEGPVWHAREKCLYFSDIPANTLYRYSREHGLEIAHQPSGFSNGLTLDKDGNLIACEHRTRAVTRYTVQGKSILAATYQGKKLNSPNDLVITRNDRVYFTDPIYGLREGNGGPAQAELAFQGVYCYQAGWSEPQLVCSDFERPNGIALTRDQKTLLIIDTVKQHIRSFSIQEDGSLSGGEVMLELWGEGEGRPDGLKLDKQDNIFCTAPGGIWVFRADGELLGKIKLSQKTANLAWGDEDRHSLYITSSHCLCRLRVKTQGLTPLDDLG